MAFGQNIEKKSQKPHGHAISSKMLPCIAHLHPKDPKRWRKENQKVQPKTLMWFEGEKNPISGEKLGGKLTQVTHM